MAPIAGGARADQDVTSRQRFSCAAGPAVAAASGLSAAAPDRISERRRPAPAIRRENGKSPARSVKFRLSCGEAGEPAQNLSRAS